MFVYIKPCVKYGTDKHGCFLPQSIYHNRGKIVELYDIQNITDDYSFRAKIVGEDYNWYWSNEWIVILDTKEKLNKYKTFIEKKNKT